MDENNQDAPEVLETPEVEETTETAPETETAEEKVARLEKEKAELESKNKQLFERVKKGKEEPVTDGLTPRDALVIAKANVHEDDLDSVLDWAKFKKVSVSDALKDPTLKAMLSTNEEMRRTAQATQTAAPRGATRPSAEDILRKAETTGEVPDTTEGMQAIFEARQARRFPKR